jgi:hypothetical protein
MRDNKTLQFTTRMFSAQFFESRNLFEVARSERRRVIASSRNLRTLYSDPRGDSEELSVDSAIIRRVRLPLEQVLKQFPNALAFERRLIETNLLN